MKPIASFLRKLANSSIWQDKIQEKFGIPCASMEPGEVLDPIILRQTYLILDTMPVELVKDCRVSKLVFSNTMGESKPFYPNHGYYYPLDKSVTLNNDIFYNPDFPDDFYDSNGYRVSRPTQTLVHEFLHGFDAARGEISLKPDWLKLSGWSETPKPGLKRMVINEPGMPAKVGEWYYKPEPYSGFTRFYAKMNPWDDFSDSATFFLLGMKNKLPENKNKYFDSLLKKYS